MNGEISYQLVFGTSCINGKITNAIDSAFEIIAAIKSGRVRERQMVDSTLFNHTYDDETTERLRQILVPKTRQTSCTDMAFGVFIGYSIDVEWTIMMLLELNAWIRWKQILRQQFLI
jgi:hypothetical protein